MLESRWWWAKVKVCITRVHATVATTLSGRLDVVNVDELEAANSTMYSAIDTVAWVYSSSLGLGCVVFANQT